MRFIKPLFLTAVAAAMVGCPSKKTEKAFPGGDLYEEKPITTGGPDVLEPEGEKKPIHLPNNKQEEGGLRLVMKPQGSSVVAGSALPVQMLVRNITGTVATVTYPSEKRFDLVVFSDQNQQNPVYQWSADKMFAQLFQEQQLSGGASVVRTLEIPTASNDIGYDSAGNLAKPLTPGTYYLWGTHEGKPFLAYGPMTITVEPRE